MESGRKDACKHSAFLLPRNENIEVLNRVSTDLKLALAKSFAAIGKDTSLSGLEQRQESRTLRQTFLSGSVVCGYPLLAFAMTFSVAFSPVLFPLPSLSSRLGPSCHISHLLRTLLHIPPTPTLIPFFIKVFLSKLSFVITLPSSCSFRFP
jgi:hypothetical protein